METLRPWHLDFSTPPEPALELRSASVVSLVLPCFHELELGGVQLLSLGIIGEYLAKVCESTEKRPRFHVEVVCGNSFRKDKP
ncbi:hypothetical protein OU994_03080 [Pseudoduganella sp. SL102]|uniref:hypothetical protein n=1 Tax=Pseudoduganella sp. SL102 TaxID=2995154 RepID=UPI00248CFC01|nr:hypothetical protein [Pseudoduganella sp. SL102]WBS03309.1 hypothetical protein OU994_03080 [Pseudoduganella sp. SL102]